jgi:hypothetical protein
MSRNFFDRLEADLGGLARRGTHLDESARHRRGAVALVRRGAVMVFLIVALTASFVSEFPASASGHSWAANAPVIQTL